MRVGVNALYLIPGKVGGTEIYLRNTLRALADVDAGNEYFVLRNSDTGPDLTPDAPNFHDQPQPVSGASRPARILYEQFVLPRVCSRLHLDVLFNAGFTAPLLWNGPMVTVFHDLQYKRHPEFFRWFDLPFWSVLLPWSAKRSQRIVVLSEAVRADLERYYAYPASRIDVIPHALEPEFARIAASRHVEAKLILSVSTLHPHKNLEALIEAFARFCAKCPGWRLVLVGLKGFDAANVEARRRELGIEDSVTITGWIERAKLYELFRTAAAFIYPSRFEGFGIPVLEAMAVGIPVACSRIPSLVEIAGDAVRYFNPDDVGDIMMALEQVTANPDSGRAGLVRAREFSAAASARRLIEVFQAAMRSKKSRD